MIPWVRGWYDEYKDDGLTVIGVHYPEFNYEENVDNVKEAAEKLGVTYPIAIDNDGLTWRAYNQRFWPTRYLVDKNGHIRYTHIGEGAYDETELVIQALLAEPYAEG